ncbi:MAG: hypothetical protein AAGD08_17065 [Pseudomonadota bacterium]
MDGDLLASLLAGLTALANPSDVSSMVSMEDRWCARGHVRQGGGNYGIGRGHDPHRPEGWLKNTDLETGCRLEWEKRNLLRLEARLPTLSRRRRGLARTKVAGDAVFPG